MTGAIEMLRKAKAICNHYACLSCPIKDKKACAIAMIDEEKQTELVRAIDIEYARIKIDERKH